MTIGIFGPVIHQFLNATSHESRAVPLLFAIVDITGKHPDGPRYHQRNDRRPVATFLDQPRQTFRLSAARLPRISRDAQSGTLIGCTESIDYVLPSGAVAALSHARVSAATSGDSTSRTSA